MTIFIDDLGDSDHTMDAENISASDKSSSESSLPEVRQCRFGGSPLETVPATPVGRSAVLSVTSPPGLSRATMRQARDSYKAGDAATATWRQIQVGLCGMRWRPMLRRSLCHGELPSIF